MEATPEFVVTSAIARLLTFLTRPGSRHAFLLGPGGSGKTSALRYLATSLRQERYLVTLVQLREIQTRDQLVVQVARSLLGETNLSTVRGDPKFDALTRIRDQIEGQFTVSQRLSAASDILDRLVNLTTERLELKPRAYFLFDGLDESQNAAELALAIEELAETLSSSTLVVASRSSPLVDRLLHRSVFDPFSLPGLTPAESTDLLRQLFLDQAVPPAVFEQMISVADGSPLVLNLLASVFRESGTVFSFDKHDMNRTLLERIVIRRLGSDQAGDDARVLLALVVLLQPVSTTHLVDVSGLNEQRSEVALQKLSGLSPLIYSSGTAWEFPDAAFRQYYIEEYIIREEIDISTLQFGDEAAERDLLLKSTFIPPRDLHFITSGIKTVILGDRGSGKSAIYCALHDLANAEASDHTAHQLVIAASQNPASFVQQMTADDSATSSADGFKAIWLLYSAALAARDIHPSENTADQNRRAFVKDARTLLRRIGWDKSIQDEGRMSRWIAALRSVLPEKVTLKLGPITVEPNLVRRGKLWQGNDIRIDDFIDLTDRFLQSKGQRLLIVFDQIDEAFKYQRDKQEALVQGLFLAEAFLSLRQRIRLVVLLRTDLFEVYDIQEKNKFVSRTVRLDWTREDLVRQLAQRLFSNPSLQRIIESLKCPSLRASSLAQIQLRIVFPLNVEGKSFEEWLFESLRNGKNQVAPRQIILFLNLAKGSAKDLPMRRQVPLITEKDVADAMTRLSELSYQEVISDFRVATSFVRNCRAGKIMEFDLDKVQTLFDEAEGAVALQLERLERLGFIERTIVREGDSLLSRFRIPRLFTRCWQTSD